MRMKPAIPKRGSRNIKSAPEEGVEVKVARINSRTTIIIALIGLISGSGVTILIGLLKDRQEVTKQAESTKPTWIAIERVDFSPPEYMGDFVRVIIYADNQKYAYPTEELFVTAGKVPSYREAFPLISGKNEYEISFRLIYRMASRDPIKEVFYEGGDPITIKSGDDGLKEYKLHVKDNPQKTAIISFRVWTG